MWSQLEPTAPHVTYIVLTFFLILYALFSIQIRNRLHLSEPPLATLFGIAVGPRGIGLLKPYEWGFTDNVVHEFTRVIVGVQCFAVGLELPSGYFSRAWKSIAVLLGPVMTFSWIVCTVFVAMLFDMDFVPASIISACLTPTDPVLAASVLSNSQFSTRVPKRVRDLLSAESGCNDGVSFPFLYIGLSVLTRSTTGGVIKKWLLVTILYQCVVGIALGFAIGYMFNRIYRLAHRHAMMGRASFLTFYFLLALFSIGVASTLGVDDFLVAFCAGLAFSHAGNTPTAGTELPVVIDLMLNSTMFVFFGAMIPFKMYGHLDAVTLPRLFAFLALVLLFRRIPIVFVLHKLKLMAHVKTDLEALFVGHFGPIGVGALFLAMQARAQLETDSGDPLPDPPHHLPHAANERVVKLVWPIICFVVLGSTMVHGASTLAISIGNHIARRKGERAALIGGETEGLGGMVFDEEEDEGQEADGGDGRGDEGYGGV